MKRIFLFCVIIFLITNLFSQDIYWVYFSDKKETSFDPYAYFDAKTIKNRQQLHISLYDESDFPLNEKYKQAVANLSEEVIGETRWFNALAVSVKEENLALIANLSFVKEIELIATDGQLASFQEKENVDTEEFNENLLEFPEILPQLERFGGELFVKNQIDGKGLRIAVFDGGFPGVDKHEAFAHLRANNQIVKTWNFPLKKENVYGWNSHGTMVLSCIAGMERGKKMGLATGAEFLLARTEVNTEPGREEVWWMQAVEWADKNGANVINSSLGYGKSRYNPKDMDGKLSLVSKAANMAAAKGMLVCNAMGNEAADRAWRVLITPADADSVLSVGGIDPQTDRRIYFSSYGPTADGRMKPNVVAYGTAQVAKPKSGFSEASGTSFSSPLVAGFVACAWQTRPHLSALEMKKEIEKSGEYYPYFDYEYGYGVPQASYFVKNNEPLYSFDDNHIQFSQNDERILITVNPNAEIENSPLLVHIQKPNGELKIYWEIKLSTKSTTTIPFKKTYFDEDDIIRVFYQHDVKELSYKNDILPKNDSNNTNIAHFFTKIKHPLDVYKTSPYGVLSKYYIYPYVTIGFILPPFQSDDYQMNYARVHSSLFGIRFKGNVCKMYNLGLSLEIGSQWFNVKKFDNSEKEYNREYIKTNVLNLEFYQRFRLVPSELFGLGLYFDTGIYGSWIFSNSKFHKEKQPNKIIETYTKKMIENINPLQWGFRARFGYEIIAIYGQYRMSNIFTKEMGKTELPKLEIGLELSLPL